MGGTKVNYPSPTAEENALTRTQVEQLTMQNQLMKESLDRQKQLELLFWEAAGLDATQDANGNITGFTKKAPTAAEAASERILNLQLQKEEAALNGDLPVDPALNRSLAEEQATMEAQAAKQLGQDWENSTAGRRAKNDFLTRKEEILDAARRGDVSLYEGMSMARQGNEDQRQNMMLDRYNLMSGNLRNAGLSFGAAAQNYNTTLGRMQQDRSNSMASQYYSANAPTFAQQWLAPIGSLMSGAGSMFSGWKK